MVAFKIGMVSSGYLVRYNIKKFKVMMQQHFLIHAITVLYD